MNQADVSDLCVAVCDGVFLGVTSADGHYVVTAWVFIMAVCYTVKMRKRHNGAADF